MGVDHYENFPVASVLCPPELRPAVVAIYHFARTADDLADEGTATPGQRLAALHAYHADLWAVAQRRTPSTQWAQVFGPLAAQMHARRLPVQPLADLLDAFMQDARNPPYETRAQVADYCRRSANPIGRLLLHLYGVGDERSARWSDAICSGLQLANFWQDLSIDSPRHRVYVPRDELAAAGLSRDDLLAGRDSPALRSLVSRLCDWAEGLLREGAPLATALPGRAGWELRFVVQGGLRILEKIRAMDHGTLLARPRLTSTDVPVLAWRALAMPRAA